MDLERAKQITSACVISKYSAMGIYMDGQPEEYVPLPDCSLEEMLIANRLVSESQSNREGERTIQMVVDPRGIAALYTREKYNHDLDDVLEAMGWELRGEDDDEDSED